MTLGKIRLLVMTVCVFFIVAFGAASGFQLRRFTGAQDQLQQKSRELSTLHNEIAEMHKYLSDYESEQAELQEYLFAEQDIPGFIDGISQYARETGIVIMDMKSARFEAVRLTPEITEGQSALAQKKMAGRGRGAGSSGERGVTLAAMPVTIKAEGDYEGFVDFLDRLEGFKQLLTISNLDVSVTGKYPVLSADFIIKIYSFKNIEDLRGGK
jgi:Tfp pilus assembly protein PilO